jgi:hypothetical protein
MEAEMDNLKRQLDKAPWPNFTLVASEKFYVNKNEKYWIN